MEPQPDAKRARLEALMGGAPTSTAAATPPEAEEERTLGPWDCDATAALRFRVVRTEADLDDRDALSFAPEFTHQVFGDEEVIYGYKGLRVMVYVHALTFHALAEVTFTEKARSGSGVLDRGPGAVKEPDDVLALLQRAFPAGLMTSRAQFVAMLPSLAAASVPTNATVVSQAAAAGLVPAWRLVRLKIADKSVPGVDIKAMNDRLQPLVLFYIDGGSLIDADDDRWDLLLLVVADSAGRPTLAGLCTVYRFFAYPDNQRLRISQVVVLPPYRRMGLGRAMVRGVYALAKSEGAMDVTTEDPSDVFRSLRDTEELAAAAAVPRLVERAAAAAAAAAAAGEGEEAEAAGAAALELDAATVKWACSELKVSKGQLTQSWEALVYRAIKAAPAATNAFKRKVMRRLARTSGSTAKNAARKTVMDTETGFVMLALPLPPAGADAVTTEADGGADKTNEEAAVQRATQAMLTATKILAARGGGAVGGETADGEVDDTPKEMTLDEQYEQVVQRLEKLAATLA